MTHDNFTTLLVALVGLIPWGMGLYLDRKRRKEAQERKRRGERIHHRTELGKVVSHNKEHPEGKSRSATGDGRD